MMKIKPASLGIASAVTMGFLWSICSLLVLIIPNLMMYITGQMLHFNLNNVSWTLNFAGFLIGLILWSLVAGVFGWILAFIYNFLARE